MLFILMQIHSLILASNSLLIEKGIITKEEFQNKFKKIYSIVYEYSLVMSSKKEDDNKEKEKLDKLMELASSLLKECNFTLSEFEEPFIKRAFENRANQEK